MFMWKWRTGDLARIAVGAALTAVCSWICVPAMVEFTLQTFAIFTLLQLLGPGRGAAAIAVYLLMGAAGLPVFAGFRGGIAALLGPTGGYLIGFLAMAAVYGALNALPGGGRWKTVLSLLAALAVLYAFGTVWFAVVYSRSSGPVTILSVLSWCVFPFVIPDLLKLVLSVMLAERIRKTGALAG